MDLPYSAEQVRVMRMATTEALSQLDATSETDKEAVARYVIMAFKMGIKCPRHLTQAAVRRFEAVRAGDALDWSPELSGSLLIPR